MHSSLTLIAFIIIVMPLDTKAKNYLEISNEFLTTILGYFGFLFTDYVADSAMRYTFGYAYIGLLAGGLLLNVINLGFSSISDLIHWYKYKRH